MRNLDQKLNIFQDYKGIRWQKQQHALQDAKVKVYDPNEYSEQGDLKSPNRVLCRNHDLSVQSGEGTKATSQPGKVVYQAWYFY